MIGAYAPVLTGALQSARKPPVGTLKGCPPFATGAKFREEERAVQDGTSKLLRFNLRSCGGMHAAASKPAASEDAQADIPVNHFFALSPISTTHERRRATARRAESAIGKDCGRIVDWEQGAGLRSRALFSTQVSVMGLRLGYRARRQ